MQVVAELVLQQPVELADGDPGLGHLHLDVAGPGVGQVALLGGAVGGLLKAGQLVEQPAGDDLAAEPAGRQRRRGVERIHHHRSGAQGVVQHHHDADADQRGQPGEEQLEGGLQPLDEQPRARAGDGDSPFLVEMLGLQLDEPGLGLQERGRVVPLRLGLLRLLHRQRRGQRVGPYRQVRLRLGRLAAADAFQQTLRRHWLRPYADGSMRRPLAEDNPGARLAESPRRRS